MDIYGKKNGKLLVVKVETAKLTEAHVSLSLTPDAPYHNYYYSFLFGEI
jgi:hypothetical protein